MIAKVQPMPGSTRERNDAPIDDRELARAARRGDERAFSDLVRRHAGGLHRAVSRILADESEAWDVVQLAFLRVWRSLDRYDAKWSFTTWLYRIGTNLAIDLLRSRSSRERAHQAGAEHHLRVVGEVDDTALRAEVGEVEGILAEVVTVLTPQQRSAFVLREVEGMDTDEVAAVLGCSTTTVRNHVCQARKLLRQEIERRYPEYLPALHRS